MPPSSTTPSSTTSPFQGTSGYVNSQGTYVNLGATPISGDTLGSPASPFNVPSQTPTTPSMSPSVTPPPNTTVGNNGLATVNPPPSSTDTGASTGGLSSWIRTQLASLGASQSQEGTFTANAQNEAQLGQKTQQATADYNAYQQAKIDQTNTINQMRTQNGGTVAGNDASILAYQRQSDAHLSNLALQSQVSQGLLSAAEKTITDKVNAQFQPIKDQIDFLTKFAQVNNNDLSESQSKALDMKIQQQKTDAASVQTAAHDIHQALLAGNAPVGSYTAVDAITQKYASGQLTASEAQSQMYAAAGKYASKAATRAGGIVTGTGGQYNSDVYQAFNSISEADKNKPQAQFGGLTKTGLYNAAELYLSENGKMPSIGLGSSPGQSNKREAIMNVGGAIADSLHLTLPQVSEMYRANSSSATQIVQRVAKIDAVSNSLANQFPRLAELADKVKGLGISEQDLTAGKAQIMKKFNNVDANNYIELINTVRADYSAMQSAIAGSRGAQYFSGTAEKAIPIGGTGDVYRGLQQTILLSASNATKGTQDEANDLIRNIGNNSLGGGGSLSIGTEATMGGKSYTFIGGDSKDIKNWKLK